MIEVINTIQIPLSKLVPNNGQIEGIPKNPRFIKSERYDRLVKSILDHPEFLGARELIVYKQGEKYIVLCGNMRYRASKELNIEQLPCKVIPEYFSLEQIKAIIIKDNISFGSDDMEALANEWEVADLVDWGYDYTDFESETESETEQKDNTKITSDTCPTCGQKIDNETPF
jgi:ParB-like chromosome segregation protein Spo0J